MVPWKRRVEITALQNQTCLPWKTGNRETWPHWRKEMGKCPKEIEFLSRIKP